METIPTDFRPLFVQWIEEEAIKATKKGSKMALLYNKSLDQLRRHESSIDDLKTLKSIKFIGEKTVKLLKKRIEVYCMENNWSIPNGFLDLSEKHSRNLQSATPSSDTRPTKRPRTTKQYVPKNRSGGFAILITLYLRDRSRKGLTRDQICSAAAPYCDRSFTSNPASKEFYSAWNSMKTLLNQQLVAVSGRSPKLYYLTDEGETLAKQLKLSTDMAINSSSPIANTTIDLSFDNGVRFDSSILNSSPIRVEPPVIHNPAHNNKSITDELNRLSKYHDSTNRSYNDIRYEIWQPQDFEVILLIDNREIRALTERDYFQKRLQLAKTKVEIRALSAGDILWIAKNLKTGRESVLNFICERKRIDDLCDSIKDGRFHEQKNRMRKSGLKHCYYIVEEIMGQNDRVSDTMESIKTSISQTITNGNLYLKRFMNIDETTNFININTQIIKEIYQDKNLVVIKPRDITNQDHYLDILSTFRDKFEKDNYECVHLFSSFQDLLVKTKQMTVKEMFLLMLMTIRGCSLEKAITIQKQFPTPHSLITYYKKHHLLPTEIQKKLMMEEFKHHVGNKKIGKVLSEKIWDVWGG